MIEKTSLLLTKREIEVIDKKLNKMKLTQQDSNYLSKYVRPKLREMSLIDSNRLLSLLQYNQKIPAIEREIKQLILDNIKYVSSIIIYGSAIYTNYKNYRDIDVLVVVRKKSWEKLGEKLLLAKNVEKKSRLKLDIKIYTEKYVYNSYPSNITLIYEFSDSKTIYGILKYPKKIDIPKLYLKMQSDYSELVLDDTKGNGLSYVSAKSLFAAIRNLLIIKLVIEKNIDNIQANKILEVELGKNIIEKLKDNTKSMTVKKIAYIYLKQLYKDTIKLIERIKEGIKWEKSN